MQVLHAEGVACMRLCPYAHAVPYHHDVQPQQPGRHAERHAGPQHQLRPAQRQPGAQQQAAALTSFFPACPEHVRTYLFTDLTLQTTDTKVHGTSASWLQVLEQLVVVLGADGAPHTPLQHLQQLVAACHGDLRCFIPVATSSSDLVMDIYRPLLVGRCRCYTRDVGQAGT